MEKEKKLLKQELVARIKVIWLKRILMQILIWIDVDLSGFSFLGRATLLQAWRVLHSSWSLDCWCQNSPWRDTWPTWCWWNWLLGGSSTLQRRHSSYGLLPIPVSTGTRNSLQGHRSSGKLPLGTCNKLSTKAFSLSLFQSVRLKAIHGLHEDENILFKFTQIPEN